MSTSVAVLSVAAVGAIMAAVVTLPKWKRYAQKKKIEMASTTEAFQAFERDQSDQQTGCASGASGASRDADVPNSAQRLYRKVNPRNPLNNVLLTEIHGNPNRRPAPPSFASDVWEDTHRAFQEQTQLLHPDQPNIINEMYGDIYENHQLETGLMRQMYSMPSTRVHDDRETLQHILAKDMFSGKEGGPEAAEARLLRSERHIMR